MISKLWALVVVVFALVLAILALSLPQGGVAHIIKITAFFDVMIPILAVGALVKYLFCCKGGKSCD